MGDMSDSLSNALAYERLAKEGRKFGLSMWLSTQRPSEVSTTVLSQCNTWISFRLTSDQDIRVVSSACEWADSSEVKRIAGLPRQHALILGGSVAKCPSQKHFAGKLCSVRIFFYSTKSRQWPRNQISNSLHIHNNT